MKKSVEDVKRTSNGLAGALFDDVLDVTRTHLSEDATHLLKFHGAYQQDDRDVRRERLRRKDEHAWQFMVRTKTPGGRIGPEQWLALEKLARQHGNGTLRITSRQGLQFHGVGKAHLKPLVAGLNAARVLTYGACGDVARNTVACPVADLLHPAGADVQALAAALSARLLPASTAYWELWLDGERVLEDGRRVELTPVREEPLYGATYMPRKHKTAIGLPNENCVDLFTHDVALDAVIEEGRVVGWNLLAGGGLGTTHGDKRTFARLADRVGLAPPGCAVEVVLAATEVYRDTGDRTNRKHARLKYVVAERGVAWFRAAVEARLGWPLAPPQLQPVGTADDHLGWHRQLDGRWMFGLWVPSGRLQEVDGSAEAVHQVVERFGPELRVTPQQNLVFAGVEDEARAEVARVLDDHFPQGRTFGEQPLHRRALTCPALPTCGQAVAEAERFLPELLRELDARGVGDADVDLRLSGCPNSCSRPPTAEIGVIGRSLGLYTVLAGGSRTGERLARMVRDDVRATDLPDLLATFLRRWRAEACPNEPFGDWADRVLVPGPGAAP